MIPFAKPTLGKEEASAAAEAVLSGWVTQGPRVKAFEEAFASYVGSRHACAVTSCTTAMHLALLASGVEPGNVVITVSHSFIATANAIRYCGAEPVFVDIDPETFNMSVECFERCLRKNCRTRGGQLFYKNMPALTKGGSSLKLLPEAELGKVAAVMPVHQMGVPCDLDGILSLAREFNVPVIEDAACAIGSEIEVNGDWEKIGKPHGDIACFSFHPRKVLTTGDGGMITTNDPQLDAYFRLVRQHGMSIPDTVRHSAKKVVFENYDIMGFNYRMTDIQAAVGIEQLKKIPRILRERRRIAAVYREELKNIPWLKLPYAPARCRINWQSYPVRVLKNAPLSRDKFMQYLLDNGISTRRGVMNAHQEAPYSKLCSSLQESENARNNVILLPFFNELGDGEIKYVAKTVLSVESK